MINNGNKVVNTATVFKMPCVPGTNAMNVGIIKL